MRPDLGPSPVAPGALLLRGSVEDITTECKPPRRGRFTLYYIESHEDPEDGALLMKLRGPEPKGGSGPIVVDRHSYVTCIVS